MYKRKMMTVEEYNKTHIEKINVHTNYEECPFCKEPMKIQCSENQKVARYNPYISYPSRNSYRDIQVYFECRNCGARSPFTNLSRELIDKNKLKEVLEDYIVGEIADDGFDNDIWEEVDSNDR